MNKTKGNYVTLNELVTSISNHIAEEQSTKAPAKARLSKEEFRAFSKRANERIRKANTNLELIANVVANTSVTLKSKVAYQTSGKVSNNNIGNALRGAIINSIHKVKNEKHTFNLRQLQPILLGKKELGVKTIGANYSSTWDNENEKMQLIITPTHIGLLKKSTYKELRKGGKVVQSNGRITRNIERYLEPLTKTINNKINK